MLRSRIIPTLLIDEGKLVKTIQFKDAKYVGDPLNAVRILNEKKIDELFIIDISATTSNTEPEFSLIKRIAEECRMPLCYGGGIKNIKQMESIINLGVEKVAVSSKAINDIHFIKQAALKFGSQSIVVVVDVKKSINNKYQIYFNNGKTLSQIDLSDFLERVIDFGAGEIVINSIDNDGMMQGYDVHLVELIYEKIDIPLTILGGAGSKEDLKNMIKKFGILGLGAGSMFVFKGKFRAVLINYPNVNEKNEILNLK